jgi:regulator of replication initiation timing
MNKLKKYENFFGGTHLGSDQVNTDSTSIRNVTEEPDRYSTEIIDDISELKNEIIDLLEENDFTNVQLEKIKRFIATL